MVTSTQYNYLKGLRVLEVTENASGSYAGRLLGESGANVIKVVTHSLLYSNFRDKDKTIISLVNQTKSLKQWDEILSEHWDIVLWDNFLNENKNRDLTFMSRDNNSSTIGIKLIFPQTLKTADESYLQSFAGWTELTGNPNRDPLIIGGQPASYLIGAHAATVGLMTLLEKSWTKKGSFIEVNVMNILTSALEGAYANYLDDHSLRTRPGNRHHSMSPMAILPCENNDQIFIGAPVDEQWELLSRWSGIPSLNKWKRSEDRFEDAMGLENHLSTWTKKLSSDELFYTGQAFRMPFAKVQTIDEVRSCSHLSERKFFIKENDEEIAHIKRPWQKTESTVPAKEKQTYIYSWQDLRILDLTSMWSGPYCTRLLADLGVEVIKVEAPHRPDGIRGMEKEAPPFFKELNRNKFGITLDLKDESDRQNFLELVKTSDVIIDNFSPRVMHNFGLTKEVLWQYQPNLVIVSLSAFGQNGIYRDLVGYGSTLESMSGVASATHYIANQPLLPGFSISDIHAGVHGAFALLEGLLFREEENKGLRIDVSQYEVSCQLVGDYLMEEPLINKESNIRHQTLKDVFQHENLTNIVMDDGSKVIGQPWENKKWIDRNKTAPMFGEHNDLLKHFINKKKVKQEGVMK